MCLGTFLRRARAPCGILLLRARASAAMLIFTAVLPAAMIMIMAMMIAMNIRIKRQIPRKQRIYSFIRIAGYSTIETDTGFCQRNLRPCSDPSADQRIYL